MPKTLRWLLFVISSWYLTSCASAPPDIFVFEDLAEHTTTDPITGHELIVPSPTCMAKIGEIACGHGVSIVSGKEIFIGEEAGHWFNGKPWSQVQDESIFLPAAESYAPLSAYIINECKIANCSDNIDAFKVKLNSLNGIKGTIANP